RGMSEQSPPAAATTCVNWSGAPCAVKSRSASTVEQSSASLLLAVPETLIVAGTAPSTEKPTENDASAADTGTANTAAVAVVRWAVPDTRPVAPRPVTLSGNPATVPLRPALATALPNVVVRVPGASVCAKVATSDTEKLPAAVFVDRPGSRKKS